VTPTATSTSSRALVALDAPARLGDLPREWLELAGRLDDTSYFQTPDWVLSWWETIARGPPTRAATWRAPSGRLEALVLLSRAREPLHGRLPIGLPVYVNAGSGAGAADHCGWLVAPAWRAAVADWLAEETAGSVLLLRNSASGHRPPPLPAGARVIAETVCPRLAIPASGEVGRSRGFGRQLRRFARRMEGEGVRFAWVDAGSVDDELLDRLFALHASTRARHGGGTSFDRTRHLPLHRRLTARAGPRRGPAAVVARCDGAVVGMLYGFHWRDTFAAYQWGWDPRWDRHSMGSVLAYQGIRFAADRGARVFDFLRGAEPYKYRFGAVDSCDRTWMVPRGPAGALLAARYAYRRS
jgi:CelD/BcsL family acetyltransferase involved in cellulose biosynthesis